MNRLKEIREDKDLLQKDIAKLLNTGLSIISAYERELYDINTKNLIELAIFYNVPIDYILYLTDERKPHKRNNKTINDIQKQWYLIIYHSF